MPAQHPTPYDDGELYDSLFDSHHDDLPYWLAFAREGRGPFLDLACGTGRVLMPLLEAGLDGDGLDASKAMLARCSVKARETGKSPALVQGDMCEFRMPRKYARIFCAFNAFAHVLETDAQIAALACVREHLSENGAFAIDLGFPRPEVWSAKPDQRVLEGEFTHPSRPTRLYLFDRRRMDPLAQTQHSQIEIEERDLHGGLLRTHVSHTVLRWTHKLELELLFRAAGYRRWEIHSGFEREPLTPAAQQMIAVAWR
ncbi:MAG: class I SAM-dependent methyltransferase [Planctomycetes bacterium]|nr:class I SAM-dependent methyltransferase [Planctomycetota bacterium]